MGDATSASREAAGVPARRPVPRQLAAGRPRPPARQVRHRARWPWFPWLATQVDWPGRGPGARGGLRRRLDVGRGGRPPARRPRPDAHRPVAGHGRPRRSTGSARSAATAAPPAGWPTCRSCRSGRRLFDVVVANYVLHHVPDAGRAVGEMARVLRPGGMRRWSPASARGTWPSCARSATRCSASSGPTRSPASFGASAGRPPAAGPVRRGRVAPLRRPARLQRPRRRPGVPGLDAAGRGRGRRRPARRVAAAVQARFDAGGGRLRVSKDTGLFVCRGPRRSGARPT